MGHLLGKNSPVPRNKDSEVVWFVHRKIAELADEIAQGDLTKVQALLGFDAAVDYIYSVVDKRTSESYHLLETISDFALRVAGAAGLSTNVEIVRKMIKPGGCGPNMATAAALLGAKVSYVGAIGKSKPNQLFDSFVSLCNKAYPVTEPSCSYALEFRDGKIMLADLDSVWDITVESLLDQLGKEDLLALVSQADLIAMVNWTETPHIQEIWDFLLTQILPLLPVDRHPMFFFDLADPEKREPDEIAQAVSSIGQFSAFGKVVFALNRKEASEVAYACKLGPMSRLSQMGLRDITLMLSEYANTYALIVHPIDRAAIVIEGSYYEVEGPYTDSPLLTTGAGDNFNAGIALALSLTLDPVLALLFGVAVSGYYVRNAKSPSLSELLGFLETWRRQITKRE